MEAVLSGTDGIIGFTDEIHLGDLERIYTTPDVAMRVFSEIPMLWRGAVLDEFTGESWKSTSRRGKPIETMGEYISHEEGFYPWTKGLVKQKIILEVENSKTIFGALHPVALEIDRTYVLKDDNDGISVKGPLRARTEYNIYSLRPDIHSLPP